MFWKAKWLVLLLVSLFILVIAGCSSGAPKKATTQREPEKASLSQQVDQGTNKELASLQRQVILLQDSFAPKTPKLAVETWAKGVQTRNGALQFAVLSKDLREKERANYEGSGWVTGQSSPWVDQFNIIRNSKLGNEEWEYEVQFELATSTGKAGTNLTQVDVKKYEDSWYISQIKSNTGGFFPN